MWRRLFRDWCDDLKLLTTVLLKKEGDHVRSIANVRDVDLSLTLKEDGFDTRHISSAISQE